MHMNRDFKKLSRIAGEIGTVRREGLTEQLVKKFEELVLRSVIAPGERLPSERELAEMLKVSRASLREALRALKVMGVLEIRQGSGNYLTENAKELLSVPAEVLVPLRGLSEAELFEVRRAMEAEAAATAALRASESDLDKIRAELDGMRGSTNNRFVYGKHDLAFHHAIAEASGNAFFVWFMKTANKFLYKALLRRPMKRSLQVSLSEHENILRGIEARDPIAARAEMLNHVSYQKYYMLDEKRPAEIRFLALEPSAEPAPGRSRSQSQQR